MKPLRIIFLTILAVSLFSLWAGFALLVVNKYFFTELPGYVIGRLCIWELVMFVVALIISEVLLRKWGIPRIENHSGQKVFIVNNKFVIYFLIYFTVALLVGIWQFYIFSLQF